MPECLACEREYDEPDSSAIVKFQYCSVECETIHEAALKESAESSKIKGLVDSEGHSILGNAYKQAVDKTIRETLHTIGILPPKKE